jgi:hypothetical protein
MVAASSFRFLESISAENFFTFTGLPSAGNKGLNYYGIKMF